MTDSIRTIAASAIADAIFSNDGTIIYAATGSTITAYSVATGVAQAAWSVASPISGIALTPDGQHLLAADRDGILDDGWTYSDYTLSQRIYSVDLSTGTITTFANHVHGGYSGFFDVAALTNDKAIVSGGGPNGVDAGFRYLDLSTGTFTTIDASPSRAPVLDSSSTGLSTVAYARNPDNGTFDLYALNSAGTITASRLAAPAASDAGIPYGNNTGLIAISDVAGLVSVGTKIFDSALQPVIDLSTAHPELTGIVGDVFDPSGNTLYLLDNNSFNVLAFSTSDWSLSGSYAVGYFSDQYTPDGATNTGAHGDRLSITPDGHTLSVVTSTGIRLVDVTTTTGNTGTSGNDDLTATDYYQSVYGLAGNDILRSSIYSMTKLIGGTGDDIYYAKDVTVNIVERPGEGIDSVFINTSTPDGRYYYYSLADNVENGTLVQSGDGWIAGNEADNRLTTSTGNDFLYGNGGNDILEGKGGDDQIDGGNGTDIAIIASTRAATTISVDADGHIVLSGPDGTDTLSSIETIRFADQDVATATYGIFGTSGDDTLSGTANADVMAGFNGNDILDGGFGADTMIGGAGDDSYSVDNAGDVVTEQANGGTDTVYTSVNYTLPPNVENLTVDPIFTMTALALTGNDANNVITLGDGGGSIAAAGGNDTLNATLGASLLDGGDGYDVASIRVGGFGTVAPPTIAFADNGDILLGEDQHLAVRNVEEIRYQNSATFNGTLYTAYLRDIDSQYVTYAARHASAQEMVVWSTALNGGTSLTAMRSVLLGAIGLTYVDAQIAQAYQTYGGRAPSAGEVGVWEGLLNGNGYDFDFLRTVILNDSLGHNHTVATVASLYQTYGGRAPNAAELNVWENAIKSGADFNSVRTIILNDSLGLTHTAATVTAFYQTYAGRAPTSGEIAAANTMLLTGSDFNAVRTSILNDATIHSYELQQITAAYQTYGERAPTSDEINVWDGALKSGASYDTIRDAVLSDPMGNHYYDQQITAAYQTYGGRSPDAGELAVWEGALRGNGDNVAVIRDAVLHDPTMGRYYADQQITAAYQTYGSRAPTAGELTVWENALGTSQNYGAVRNAILNDPMGHAYIDAQITAAYQIYGGRAPTSDELTVWENALNGNNHDFSVVRTAILDDPMGITNSTTQIASLYQRYHLRAPTADEQNVWHSIIHDGKDFDVLRDVLMTDPGSAGTTQQLSATVSADTFHFASTPYLAISGFDPAHDVIDARGLGFSSIDPLDAAHARQIHAYDGTPDVLITLDATHEILLHNVSLAQLSGSDFLL